jgi:beta-galactosidase
MKKISFNQDWTFQKGTGGIFAMISGASGEAQKVNLPHDAEILTPRNPDEPNGSGNGFFRAENYIYSKDFELKEEDFGKTVFLEFEGVYENAFVYVNKAFAGKHPYGYGNFYLDLTDFVKAGSNNVRVEVKNAVPSGRWYTGGGIYRNVNLMIAERTHIVPDGVKVAPSPWTMTWR